LRGPFINADIIQRDELKDASMAASYRAAEIAGARRSALLDARKSFATETVFFHPSKLEIIEGRLFGL
jgi:predicted ABC-type ATPase